MNKWDMERQKADERNAKIELALSVARALPIQYDAQTCMPFLALEGITGPRVDIPAARLYLHGFSGAFAQNHANNRSNGFHSARLIIGADAGAKVYGQHVEVRLDLRREDSSPSPVSSWRATPGGYRDTTLAGTNGAECGNVARSTIWKVAELLAERFVRVSDLRAAYAAQAQREADYMRAKANEAAEEARLLAERAESLRAEADCATLGDAVLAVLDASGRLVLTTTDKDTAERERAAVYVHKYDAEDGKRASVSVLFPEGGAK